MAYGVNAPFGLQPRRMITGAPWNGQMNEYPVADVYATSVFTGDPVTTNANGTITMATAGTGNAILGVFMGCTYLNTNGVLVTSAYWPANTATFQAQGAKALVVDDPNVLFDIQFDNNGVAAADLNANTNINLGAGGSTVTGQSSAFAAGLVTDNTPASQLKIMALTPYVGNVFAVPYNNILVLINNHILKGGTGTRGV